jgi:hypothetical protein
VGKMFLDVRVRNSRYMFSVFLKELFSIFQFQEGFLGFQRFGDPQPNSASISTGASASDMCTFLVEEMVSYHYVENPSNFLSEAGFRTRNHNNNNNRQQQAKVTCLQV